MVPDAFVSSETCLYDKWHWDITYFPSFNEWLPMLPNDWGGWFCQGILSYRLKFLGLVKIGSPYWKGRLSTVDLLVLTSLDQLLLIVNHYLLFYKTSYLNGEVNCTLPSTKCSVIKNISRLPHLLECVFVFFLCLCVWMYVFECVCVCVWERERE